MVVRKKSFGQHFLHDRKVMHDISRAVGWQEGERLIEIGPGTGRLTRCLLEHVPIAAIDTIEFDREMITHLAESMPELRVHHADAARVDWSTVLGDDRARLVGNLPYNAAAPIFFHALDHRHRFPRMVFMFQREMAARFVATPGSGEYGPPSVMARLLTVPQWLFVVRPSAFRPPPKVDSAVAMFDPRPEPLYGILETEVAPFNAFVHGLFRQRRKTLRNNLRAMTPLADTALEAAGVDGIARPETLDIPVLVRLFREFQALPAPPAP